MTGLDTNILARYYIEEPDAGQKTQQQRKIAHGVMLSGKPLFVAKTVILEFEWVCRSVYELEARVVIGLITHLLGLEKVEIEDVGSVETALEWHRLGLDFADALHLASSASAREFITFDKRGFASRANRLKTSPPVRAA